MPSRNGRRSSREIPVQLELIPVGNGASDLAAWRDSGLQDKQCVCIPAQVRQIFKLRPGDGGSDCRVRRLQLGFGCGGDFDRSRGLTQME
jgi:hypothetical protein